MLKAANEIFEFKVKTPFGDIKPGKLVEKLFSKSKKPRPPA
ncbi:MAG: hypothetical protein NT166_27845 [Candidatus Aminicenantes bacterium]|nr:hypothetical protein [Candidatus Aminicenantes bacterium]